MRRNTNELSTNSYLKKTTICLSISQVVGRASHGGTINCSRGCV